MPGGGCVLGSGCVPGGGVRQVADGPARTPFLLLISLSVLKLQFSRHS